MNCANQSENVDPEEDDDIMTLMPLWVRIGAFLLMPVAAGVIISLAHLNLLPGKAGLIKILSRLKPI